MSTTHTLKKTPCDFCGLEVSTIHYITIGGDLFAICSACTEIQRQKRKLEKSGAYDKYGDLV